MLLYPKPLLSSPGRDGDNDDDGKEFDMTSKSLACCKLLDNKDESPLYDDDGGGDDDIQP